MPAPSTRCSRPTSCCTTPPTRSRDERRAPTLITPSPRKRGEGTSMKVSGCRWVNVRGSSDSRGTVSFIETGIDLDFAIRRAFWIHGVPVGQPRGHHAHRYVRLAMIAVAGGADLVLD